MKLGFNLILTLIVGLGSTNALLRPAIEAVRNEGWVNALVSGFEISVVIWLSLSLVAAHFLTAKPREIRRRDHAVFWCCLLLLLVPSATVSWLGLAILATITLLERKNSQRVRAGGVILLATAIREPLTNICLALFAKSILEFDANMVVYILSLFTEGFRTTGNIIEGSKSHSLIVLSGCASISNLSLALLAWTSLTLTLQGNFDRRSICCGVSLLLVIPSLNYLRLATMAFDQDHYNYFHSGMGLTVFDMALSTTVLVIVLYGAWNANKDENSLSLFDCLCTRWFGVQGIDTRRTIRLK